ncbi:MAG TPA: heterodisulfide reductase-related iron-sulfur binding cluster, partial [bacterium]|nr:heterodisulfide reductase-related iron-sulfur binding cluster [bacterium]
MDYLYYPGCSLKSTGRPYDESIRAVFQALGLNLTEVEDWNCCGATAYMAVNELKAYALASRNLALSERQGTANDPKARPEVVVPCAACYLVLCKAQRYLAESNGNAQKIRDALKVGGLKYKGKVKIRHPLDIFVN